MEEMASKKILDEFKKSKINKQMSMINKFIEKFPKAKLHNVSQINKYFNDRNIELDENFHHNFHHNFNDEISNSLILNYLEIGYN